MLELNKKEMIIRYSAIGFVLGTALTITAYGLLLHALETHFSFRIIAKVHGDLPILLPLDLIAIPALFFGVWIGRWRFKAQEIQISGRQIEETSLMIISTDLDDEVLYALIIL